MMMEHKMEDLIMMMKKKMKGKMSMDESKEKGGNVTKEVYQKLAKKHGYKK